MTKQIAFITAKPGLSRDALIHRYEDGHVPLISRTLPFFDEYRRSFLRKENEVAPSHLQASHLSIPFDVVTELWFQNPGKIAEMGKLLAETNAGEIVAEDERAFLDRTKLAMLEVEERRTEPSKLAPRPAGVQGMPAVKMVCFLPKRKGSTASDFMNYYESRHAVFALELLQRGGVPFFARYNRSYLQQDKQFPIGEGGVFPYPFNFDGVTSIWFWTEDDYQRFLEACGKPDIAAQLAEDEGNFMDRDNVKVFRADEFGTRLDGEPIGVQG